MKEVRQTVPAIVLACSLVALACAAPSPDVAPPVLLFTGSGTSPNDVSAVEAVLRDRRVEYATATSRELNAMSEKEMMKHRLLIVPGGDFIAMSESLSPGATATMHDAVQHGLNYLAICAGAFLAAHGTYNSVNLTAGARFGFYAAERQGIRKAAVAITGVDASPVEHYWEDGPELTGWGAVVARYPNGTPAVVEGSSGKGWVILTGVHPEAPESWRRGMTFTTPASIANAYAGTLVDAALNGRSLPHF